MTSSTAPSPAAERVLFLTGAAGGIGRAILTRARREGYRVFAVDRVQESDPGADPGVRWHTANVTRDDEVTRAFVTLDRTWERLDAVVLAAGAVGAGRVEDVPAAEFRGLLELNLTAAFFCAHLALPRLRARGGSIVFLSSTNGLTGGSPLSGPAYAVAKAGLIALTKNIARDYGPDGVRANCVAPGPIDTPMLDRLSSSVKDSLRRSIPLGQIGTPEDVANVVNFLVSDEARYLTGITVSVSGGLVMA